MSREYGITEYVPAEDRHIGFLDMTLTWMGANCQPGSWMIGGTIAAVGAVGAFGITILANPIAYAVLALIGYMAYKVSTTTMGLTRASFGILGSKLPTLCNTINILGWTAVANFFAAITISYICKAIFGTPAYGEPGSELIIILGAAFNGILSLAAVYIAGTRSIKIAERIMMILLIFLTTWLTIVILRTTSLAQIIAWRPEDSARMPIGLGIDAMLAFSMTWSTVVGDFTRYTKTKLSATLAPMLGANLAVYWFCLVGVLGVISVSIKTGVFNPNNADPSSICISLGLGWLALFVVIFSTVTTNMIDIYAGTLNLMNLREGLNFNKTVLFTGITSILISWIPIFVGSFITAFYWFMNILGAVFPPLLAIMITDYFLIRKSNYKVEQLNEKNGPYWYTDGINWYAVISWLIGVLLFIFMRNIKFGMNNIGAVLPGFFLSGLIYWIAANIAIKQNAYQDVSGKISLN